MKITGLDIERFGIWQGLQLRGLQDGLTVFYGPNEAGKTTLMEFLRSVFYGYDNDRRRYLPIIQRQGRTLRGSAGGYVSVQSTSGRFEVSRFYDPARPEDERQRLEIMGLDGTRQGEHMLQVLLGNVDERTFNNVFAIGLDELQRLATLDDTEAADLLYRLSIGLDRISLVEVMETLVQSRNHLLDAHGTPARIDHLFQRRDELIEEIRQGRGLLREYTRVWNEKGHLDQQAHRIEEEHEKYRHEARLLEIALAVRDLWQTREQLLERLEEMGRVEPVSEETVRQLVDLEKAIAERRRQISELRKHYRQLREETEKLDINETLWKMAPRIEILQQQGDWITSLQEQVDAMELEVESAREQIVRGHREIGVDHESGTADRETVPRSPETFRGPARTIHRAKSRLKKAKEQLADLKEKHRLLTERLENEMDRHGATDLSEAIERLSDLTALLRRRQGLSERLAEMENYLAEMEDQNAYLIENQALPLAALAGLGLMAIGGAVLATLWGLGYVHFLFGILGLVAVVAGIGIKIYVERSNARKLEGNQRQLSLLISQIEQVREESSAIDAKLPPGEGAAEYHMEKAEQQLAALEQLVPYQTQRHEIERQIDSAEQHAAELQRSLRASLNRWKDLLKRARLPVDLTPVQVRDVLARYDEMGDLRRRKDQRQEELEQKRRELTQVTERIDQLIAETDVRFPAEWSVLEKLRRLGERLAENEAKIQRREALREQARQLRRQGNKWKTLLAQQSRRRRQLLVEYGVDSSQELMERAERYSDYLRLVNERQRVQREIDAAIGGYCGEEVIGRQLVGGRREQLDSILQQTGKRIDAAKERLHHTLQKQGQLAERLEILAQDRRQAKKHLELGTVNEKIRKAVSQWQQRAVACGVLEEIRRHYERDRQPETLREASTFFRQLTRGGYKRIWTPMGENSLYVDDAQGNTFDVQWLSRGTREQLFVALRLALAASFARRGAMLPMVMDDVLVNFDTARAASAAAVLGQFAASGRQVLLFTCHRHVCRIFEMLEVPVHTLPSPTSKQQFVVSAPESEKSEEIELDIEPPAQESPPPEAFEDEAEEPIEEEEASEENDVDEPVEEEELEGPEEALPGAREREEIAAEPENEPEPEVAPTLVMRVDPSALSEDPVPPPNRPLSENPPQAEKEDHEEELSESRPSSDAYTSFQDEELFPSPAFVSRVENAIGFFNGEEFFDGYLMHDSPLDRTASEPEKPAEPPETEDAPAPLEHDLAEQFEESPPEEENATEEPEANGPAASEPPETAEGDFPPFATTDESLSEEETIGPVDDGEQPFEMEVPSSEELASTETWENDQAVESDPNEEDASEMEEDAFPQEQEDLSDFHAEAESREWDDFDPIDEIPDPEGDSEEDDEEEDDDFEEEEPGDDAEDLWDEDAEEFDDFDEYEEYDEEDWEDEEEDEP